MSHSSTESFRHINELKVHLSSADHDSLLKPENFLLRLRLQTLCRSVLLMNLETSLDQKTETDLWNFAFKAQITALQHAMKQGKISNSRKAEIQADLNLFLENALGFYMQLMQDICETFHLHPPFRKKQAMFGIIQERPLVNRKSHFRIPSRRSSMYICQYSLVHLGDVARYLQRNTLAENFYNFAVNYAPSNGQPYNQLAILCATRSSKLAVTYYYVRSIAVRSPFPVAATNLEKMYNKQVKESDTMNFVSKNKWLYPELITAFLYLHSLVHLQSDPERAIKMSTRLTKVLSSHTIFAMLSSQNLIHMLVISLFTISHTEEPEMNQEGTIPDKAITEEEKQFIDIILLYIVSFLEILLNHAPKSNVREHITLPCIKLLLEWLLSQESHLSKSIIKTHGCWLSLARTLNAIQNHCKDTVPFNPTSYEIIPLAEDMTVQCFTPLVEPLKYLDYSTYDAHLDSAVATKLRCYRIVELGKKYTEKYPSLNLIDYEVNTKNGRLKFSAPTAITVEPKIRKNTARQNVAIQAIGSRETQSMEEGDNWPSWPVGNSSSITPQGDAAQAFSYQSSEASAIIPSLQRGSSLDRLHTASPPIPNQSSRQPIGSEVSKPKTLAELLEETKSVDSHHSSFTNLSASDSSVFGFHGSYSLFSTEQAPFDLANMSSASQSRPPDLPSINSFDSGPTFGWSNQLAGTPDSQSSPLEPQQLHQQQQLQQQQLQQQQGLWGNSSPLAQLLEAQKKHQNSSNIMPNRPSTPD